MSELEKIVHKYCGASKTQYLDGDFVLPEVIEAKMVDSINEWFNRQKIDLVKEMYAHAADGLIDTWSRNALAVADTAQERSSK